MTSFGPTLDASGAHPGGELLLTDFTSSTADWDWYVVNDNVMGGRSEGDFEQEPGQLRFSGRTNTRGGGFSSIRTGPLQLDLSNHAGIRLEVSGDGRRYTWRLATAARWRGRQISYWADFDTASGTWSAIDIPFSRFIPRFRGRQLDGPALDTGQITGMGLMIYDRQDGPFEIYIASVQAFSADAPFTLMQYQWENRVLVVSAPSEDDEILGDQLVDVTSTLEEFADRDMVLVTLFDDGVSKAGERRLTSDEVATARASLAIRPGSFALRLIGKDGTVKLASETVTPMTEIYSRIDAMPMRQRETSDR